jgi:hypothetical protein
LELSEAVRLGISVEAYRALLKLTLKTESALDLPTVRSLAQQADFISAAPSGGVSTLVWSLDKKGHHLVQVRGASYGDAITIDLGGAADLTRVDRFVFASQITLLEGDFPENQTWHKWLATTCKRCVLSSRRSANRTIPEKAFAALLGRAVPRIQAMRVYNALPYEQRDPDSTQERTRMGIDGSKDRWIEINKRIRSSIGVDSPADLDNGIKIHTARKEPLMEELREGNADVVLIFAHSDGRKIYLPGRNGSSISIDELRTVRRKESPPRAVILVACEAGAVNQDTNSFAEALVENNLAATVFAYPGRVSASYIPEMFARLRTGVSLRDAFPGLYQIVNMEGSKDEFRFSLRLRFGIQFEQIFGTSTGRGSG